MIYLREEPADIGVTFVWHCPPPSHSQRFVVMSQEWSEDFRERHIYRIELIEED